MTDQVTAAYIVDGPDGMPFDAPAGDTLARVPGVEEVSHVRVDKALVAGDETDVTGVDPATIARFYRFAWTDGSEAAIGRLASGGALVTQTYADDKDLAVGDPLSIQTASGDKQAVAVAGIYDPPEIEQMLGSITIAQQAFDEVFPQPKNKFTFLDAGPDANQALTAAAADFSEVNLHTGAAFAKDYTEGFASFLNFLYVLLAFSVVGIQSVHGLAVWAVHHDSAPDAQSETQTRGLMALGTGRSLHNSARIIDRTLEE